MAHQLNINENKNTKLGYYTVKMKHVNNSVTEHEVQPLTQKELASGWQQVLPKKNRNSSVHHFSVYLSQLPPYLWSKLCDMNTNPAFYSTIKDNIYHYTVKKSKADDTMQRLNHELFKTYPDVNVISTLYDKLEQQGVKGWLMLKAKHMLQ